jgi:CelD/BcsL family acetyltransferase involved in cellulose biosynthesis
MSPAEIAEPLKLNINPVLPMTSSSPGYSIAEIDPLSDERWDRFVEEHPFGWICHHSGWKKVLERSFRHLEAHYFVLLRGGRIQAGLPVFAVRSWLTGNRLVSIPFASISDPLVSSGNDLAPLLDAVIELAREKSIYTIEIRSLGSSPCFRESGLGVMGSYKHHYLPLDRPPEELMKTFHRSCVRQRISRSVESGLEVVEAKTKSDLRDFYRLHMQSRKRLALPPQPYIFIESLFNTFHPQGRAALLLGKKDGKAIAALLLLKFNGRASAEFAVYDETYLNISPIHQLFWEAIKSASAENYRVFDFGRTSPSNEKLMEFKGRWGTKVADMPLYCFPPPMPGNENNMEDTAGYKLIRKTCKSAPGFALRRIGNFCYRHLG